MTAALLDTNVLIALLDPSHAFHTMVTQWFSQHSADGWATCPITQNGFVRIVSHHSYPQSIAIHTALSILRKACDHNFHHFWSDDIGLADQCFFDHSHLLTSGQVTDTYLLGLAKEHGAHFVTLDRRVDVLTVRNASASSLQVLDPHIVG